MSRVLNVQRTGANGVRASTAENITAAGRSYVIYSQRSIANRSDISNDQII